jgi:GWxTD domain-containing protein
MTLRVSRLLSVKFFSVCVYLGLAGTTLQPQSSSATPRTAEDPLQRPRPTNPQKSKSEKVFQRWLDEDVTYIITPQERDAFKKLTNDAERESFVETFWDRRNLDPGSAQNEYKEEHYRRKAFANERFAAGIPGWKTDRGRIYILHGPPDSIESHPAGGPYTRTAEEGGGTTTTYPFEIWRYRNITGVGEEIELEFVDVCGCGEYQLTGDRGLKDISNHVPGMGPTLAESMGRATQADRFRGGAETLGPSLFGSNQTKEFERIETLAKVNAEPPLPAPAARMGVTSTIRSNLLPFDVRVDFVKADAGTVLAPITIQVPNHALTYVVKDGVQRVALAFSGAVKNLNGRVVATFEEPLRLDVPSDQLERFAADMSLFQETLLLHPGLYRLDLLLKDMNGDKLGIFARSIRVPDFSDTDKLSTSTLILADLMDPIPPREIGQGSFVLGSKKVRPRVPPSNGQPVAFARGQKVNLWMQVYNLALDTNTGKPSAIVAYRVVNTASGKPVLDVTESTEQMSNPGSQLTVERRIVPGILESGVYQATISIKDLIANRAIEQETKFTVK